MKNSVREELLDYAKEQILELGLDLNDDDLHHKLFNEDYYIIGYYNASEWLKKHNIGEFESIDMLEDLHSWHFGENTEVYKDPERVVNMLVYFYGFEIVEELKELSDAV
jgi:hypothetical protein